MATCPAQACAAVRDASDGAAEGVRWRVGAGWAGKVEAVTAALRPYGGVVGVSEAEPMPDQLLEVSYA